MYGLFKSPALARSTSLQDSNRTHASYNRRKSGTFSSTFPESISDVSIASSRDIPSAAPPSHTLNTPKRPRHHMRYSSLSDSDATALMLSPDAERSLSFGSTSSSIASTRSSSGSPIHREISSMDDYFSFPSLDPTPSQGPPKPKSFLDFWMIKSSHTTVDPDNAEVEMEPYEEIVVNGVRL